MTKPLRFLASLAFLSVALLLVAPDAWGQNAWINEFHYDNNGGDTGEFVEVVIENPGDFTLGDFEVVLYNGSGGSRYDSETVDNFTTGETQNGFTVYSANISGIQNGNDGIALCYQDSLVSSGATAQFLSYEGTFAATDGCANGASSTDVGVAEASSTPIGQSLQLEGSGANYEDFAWAGPSAESPGDVNAGQTLTATPAQPTVQFASAGATVNEGDGSVSLPVTITDAPADQQTTVDVAFDGGSSTADASDFSDASTQTVTFAPGADDGSTQNATFTVVDDGDPEGDEDAVFALQNPSVPATVGSPGTYTLTIADNEAPPAPVLVINEFMPDPNGSTDTDLNDDGSADTGDEFVEILNAGSASVDLGGFQLDDVADAGSSPYTFPDGASLGAGEYAVVIGDANGQTFGAFTDSGVPTLNNGGDDIRLLDSLGSVVTSVSYPDSLVFEGVSAARNPDGSGGFERQDGFGQMPSETAGQNNETGAGNGGTTTTVQFASASASTPEGDSGTSTFDLTVTISNPDGSSDTMADVVLTGGDATEGDDFAYSSPQTVTFPGGTSADQTVTVTINGDTDVEMDETATFELQNVTGGNMAAAGTPSTFTLTIATDDQSADAGNLIVTEFMADPSDVGDSDGEYFEVYNDSGASIDLDGYTVSEDGGSPEFTFGPVGTVGTSTTTVSADSFYVVCANGDAGANGGIACDYATSDVQLSNGGDEIVIADAGGAEIIRATYTGSSTGASSELAAFADARDDAQAVQDDYQAGTLNIDGSGTDLGSPGGLGAAVEISGDAGWRMLAAPVSGIDVEHLSQQNLVQGIPGSFPGADVNLYTAYDPGEGCANGDPDYDCPAGLGDVLEQGAGFYWYFFDSGAGGGDPLPDVLPSPVSGGPTGDVTADFSGVEDADQDFYLLGNPYDSDYDLSGLNLTAQDFAATVQVWDPNASPGMQGDGSYVPITQDGSAGDSLSVWQGFFAERTSGSATTLTFSEDGQVADAADFIGGNSTTELQRRILPLRLTGRDAGGAVTSFDRAARLYFHPGALLPGGGPDVWDATKLTPFTNGPFATLALQAGGALKAQEGLPFELGSDVAVPLRFARTDAEAGETFTITWPRSAWENIPDGWALTLTDSQTSATVDLRADTAYTFAPAPGGSNATAGSAPATEGRPLRLAEMLARAPAGSSTAGSSTAGSSTAGAKTSASSSASLPPARFTLTVGTGTIPVELAGLSATADGADVVLSWRTLSETNNAGFEVQQQAGGRFAEVGFVEGAGTTTEPQGYRFRVTGLEPGRHRFRLRQLDAGGRGEQFSAVVEAVALPSERYVLRAPYPNPFSEQATVEFAVQEAQAVTVALYNALGQRVRLLHEGAVPAGELQRVAIPAGSLASGLYIVRLRGADGGRTQTVTLVR